MIIRVCKRCRRRFDGLENQVFCSECKAQIREELKELNNCGC